MIYKIIAFIILSAFYCCYIIKFIKQRKDGIKTDQLGKGKSGLPKVIEIILKISSYIIMIADIVSIIVYSQDAYAAVLISGLTVSLIGTLVFIKAVIDMKSNWRAGISETDKTELVMNGIYSWSRNPAFLGFDFLYIGTLIAFFNIALLVITVATIIIFHLQIVKVEEPFLCERFGQTYIDYSRTVNRYFGKRNGKRRNE